MSGLDTPMTKPAAERPTRTTGPPSPVQGRDQGVLVVGEGDAEAADRAAVSGEGDGLGGEGARRPVGSTLSQAGARRSHSR